MKKIDSSEYTHYEFDTVDSTNLAAKWHITENGLDEPAIFFAHEQTAGRGRLGRTFYSPKDTGIYMTLAWPIDVNCYGSYTELYTNAVRVTGKAAVAVVRGIESVVNVPLSIKWVNDIYLDGRKICGILTESVPFGDKLWLLVGIGVNLDTVDFPEEIAWKAGSLSYHEMRPEAKEWIREAIERELIDEMIRLDENDYIDMYREYSCVLHERVVFGTEEEKETGTAISIDDKGALLVRKDDGTEVRLSTGEITLSLEEELLAAEDPFADGEFDEDEDEE